MGLEQIIEKQPVITTPRAIDIAESPQEFEERFKFHVSTHVGIANLTSQWDKILKNLEKRKSATGLIYADTGYGKTATAVAFWYHAENKNFVAVPPFIWNSIEDMLIATHGWIKYRLSARRPDFIPQLEEKCNLLLDSSIEDYARRISQTEEIPLEHTKRTVRRLKDEGKILETVSANGLIDYLEKAVPLLKEAGYNGLLIFPDEFELFANINPDIAKNFAELKDLIFPIFQNDRLPIALIVLTYRKTFAQIRDRENYMLARFNKPEGGLIDLETIYGFKHDGHSFADELWDKLSVACKLSDEERKAITKDVLKSLGQFLTHQRRTAIFSGPRSVVATFRRAALKYSREKKPYTIFDFCDDYLKQGMICFNQQETDTLKAYTSIVAQPIINNEAREKVVKLLCIYPDGVLHEIFSKQNIPDEDRLAVVQGLLGTHVINKVIGPTIVQYKDSLEKTDQLIEILKELKNEYNAGNPEVHRAAVRAFTKYIIPEIFRQRAGASPTGWAGLRVMEGNLEPVYQMRITGTSIPEFPDRTLTVHVGTDEFDEITGEYQYSQLFVSFIFDLQNDVSNACQVKENGLYFRFDTKNPFDDKQIPREISKLGDLFLPESITPLLLLTMLDFLDKDSTISTIKHNKQEPVVNLLKSQIRNQLIGYFFSDSVKQSAVSHKEEITKVPIGKDFVERSLAVIIREVFPNYRAIATAHRWVEAIKTYINRIKAEPGLAIRKGVEPVRTIGMNVPGMFGVSAHTTFESTYYPNGVYRDLLRVDEIDENGKTIEERITVKSNQTPVGVFFTLHSLETRVIEKLEQSNFQIQVSGKDVKAIKFSDIFSEEQKNGYLEEEIKQLIEILKARGLVDEEEKKGVKYLFLVKLDISIVELESKREQLEQLDQLARSKGFTPRWNEGESPKELADLFQKKDFQKDELLKDATLQRLINAEKEFKNQCAEWLKRELDKVRQKEYEISALKVEIPSLIEQTTGHPTTEFSPLLFQDIRNDIQKQYRALEKKISETKSELGNKTSKALSAYTNDKTPQSAIEAAAKLQELLLEANSRTKTLQENQNELDQLFSMYGEWRNLARKIEQFRVLMSGANFDDAVNNLIIRLDDEQRRIKQHLADRSKKLIEVFEHSEHFTNRIADIDKEFNQLAANQQDRFILFKAEVEEKLRAIIDQPVINETFNPSDERGCYQRVREKAVEKIKDWVLKPIPFT